MRPEMSIEKQRWTINLVIVVGLLLIAAMCVALMVKIHLEKSPVPNDLSGLVTAIVAGLLVFLQHSTGPNREARILAPEAETVAVTQQADGTVLTPTTKTTTNSTDTEKEVNNEP